MINKPSPSLDVASAETLYLNLLKGVLTRTVVLEKYQPLGGTVFAPTKKRYRLILRILARLLKRKDLEIVRQYTPDPRKREEGADWPPDAETMVGIKRLDNIQRCVADVILNQVPGDLIETGVWRGGCSIFMKGVLEAYGDKSRTVWLADSFQGLPKPNPETFPADAGDEHWTKKEFLGIALETVRKNFERYSLLDDRVKFLPGWFKDTLPDAPISQLAILRLDGDMYESTMQALTSLYPKVSHGGYVIVDDYGLLGCKAAVNEYRDSHGIVDPIRSIDGMGVYWKRTAEAEAEAFATDMGEVAI